MSHNRSQQDGRGAGDTGSVAGGTKCWGLANHFKIILEFTPITSVLNIDQDCCCVRLCLKIIYLGQGGRNWRDEALCDEGLWKLFGGRSNSSVEVCLTYKRLILSLTRYSLRNYVKCKTLFRFRYIYIKNLCVHISS